MKKLSSKDIKEYELKILLSLQEFCKKNNLRFYLSGGTLLGAIRHHGFIPWDDDIDVCMPRPDYEKMIDIYSNDHQQYCLRAMRLGNFTAPFAKLVDTNTQISAQYTTDEINSQLWIDIFPVDGLPESISDVEKIYKKCDFYRRIYLIADAKLGEGKTTFHKYGKYILKPLSNLYGKSRCVKKIEDIARQYPYQNYQYVGAITWGLYGVGERMLKSEFEKQVMVEFEGHQFPTFSCWDSYLRGLYHDYMQLPPVEKRQTHDMEVYVKD
ncbi:MAG: phosphorylcholine transferase LicD [Mitsuokella sp.]|uniref:LicD family protein n=1 Tax=Mitsuokella sp. TaxID=2049034 RepID=UPI003F11DA41